MKLDYCQPLKLYAAVAYLSSLIYLLSNCIAYIEIVMTTLISDDGVIIRQLCCVYLCVLQASYMTGAHLCSRRQRGRTTRTPPPHVAEHGPRSVDHLTRQYYINYPHSINDKL